MAAEQQIAGKVEIHYFFSDESHSINAQVRNKCESNLLAMFKEISSILNARLQVETEPYPNRKGGLAERFVLKARSPYMQNFAAGLFYDMLPLEIDLEKTVNEEDKEETKNRIENLRRELRQAERDENVEVDMENVLYIFEHNLKINKLKSNFYKQLAGYDKVVKVSVQLFDGEEGHALGPGAVVESSQFSSFVLKADVLKPELDEEATIDIVSPVLTDGNYKWKGIYVQDNKTISFAMKDEAFKTEVVKNATPFKNGTRITCQLEKARKMNEFGEVVVTGYSVLLVSKRQDGTEVVETPQGKAPKKKKEPEMQQLDLFGSLFN
ncbi:MAG TPA: hypothetical protein VK174_04125 [Chitinophagales bacterium]|nr:hypothetical protein [Chitinophagales bacterium]